MASNSHTVSSQPDYRRAFRYIDIAVVVVAMLACIGLLVANMVGDSSGPPPSPAPTTPATPIAADASP